MVEWFEFIFNRKEMRERNDILKYKDGYIRKILNYQSGKQTRTWVKDLTGLREGRLTVISLIDNQENRIEGKPVRWKWLCMCDCGKKFESFANNLGRGHTVSCGCLGRENATKSVTKHGLGQTPEYHTWFAMMSRCYDPKNIKSKNYLGRGITVCERWQTFELFYSDIFPKPKGLTLDRIDNDLGYNCGKCEYCIKNEFKLNVRWANWEIQSRNKTTNRFFSYNGEKLVAHDWAKKYGLDKDIIRNRLFQGWTVERAINTPVIRRKRICQL